MMTWDLRRLQQRAEKKAYEPIYLFLGDEGFLVEEALNTIRTQVLQPETKDFNFDSFWANEVDSSRVREAVETLPMMGDKRLIILRDVDEWKDSQWEALYPLFDNPVDSSVFVMTASEMDRRKKAFKKITEKGILVELKKPYENQLPEWISYLASRLQLELDRDAIGLLQQFVGSNLFEIQQELKKLKEYLGEDRRKVIAQDVSHVVSQSRVQSIFELTDALGKKDKASAFQALANLLDNKQSEIGVLAMVARHFRILESLLAGQRSGLSGVKLTSSAGIPQFLLTNYMQQLRFWNEGALENVVQALHETDKALKSSPLSSHIWLENLILKITK